MESLGDPQRTALGASRNHHAGSLRDLEHRAAQEQRGRLRRVREALGGGLGAEAAAARGIDRIRPQAQAGVLLRSGFGPGMRRGCRSDLDSGLAIA